MTTLTQSLREKHRGNKRQSTKGHEGMRIWTGRRYSKHILLQAIPSDGAKMSEKEGKKTSVDVR